MDTEQDLLFWRLVVSEMRSQNTDLRTRLMHVVGEHPVVSGRLNAALHSIGRENLVARATRIWDVLMRVLGPSPSRRSDAADLKTTLGRAIEQQRDEILREVQAALPSDALRIAPTELDAEVLAQRERFEAEIDLLSQQQNRARVGASALLAALTDLRKDLDQLVHADWQHADGLLRRFVAHFAAGSPLSGFAHDVLPTVDYRQWRAAIESTSTVVLGSAVLDWPTRRAERVALQLELLREVASSSIGIRGKATLFFQGDYPARTAAFIRQVVVPFFNDLLELAKPIVEPLAAELDQDIPAPRRTGAAAPFVAPERIEELRDASPDEYDLRKLVRLCEELNGAWERHAFFSVAMLVRAVLDHVPPIFGFQTFVEVANNYSGGKSFKIVVGRLQETSRSVANLYLHATVRREESLPNARSVDVSVEFDQLLAEVERIVGARRGEVPSEAT